MNRALIKTIGVTLLFIAFSVVFIYLIFDSNVFFLSVLLSEILAAAITALVIVVWLELYRFFGGTVK